MEIFRPDEPQVAYQQTQVTYLPTSPSTAFQEPILGQLDTPMRSHQSVINPIWRLLVQY